MLKYTVKRLAQSLVTILLIATIVSFGGLSVIGQSVSMAAGSGIRVADILQIKFMHGIFSGILAMLLTRVML